VRTRRLPFAPVLLLAVSLSFAAGPASAQGRAKPKPTSPTTVTPQCVTGCLGDYSVSVSPFGGEVGELPNTNNLSVVFTVRNTGAGEATDTYQFHCLDGFGVTCVSVVPTSATLDPGQRQFVTVTFNTGPTIGSVYLTADGVHASAEGWYFVRFLGAPTVALRNPNGDNRDRSLCLTAGAGEAAAWQCGDLLVSHGLPAYPTMGRDRSLSLVYSSAQAVPRPVVAAVVDQYNVAVPSSVFTRLLVNGVPRDSATYSGWGAYYTATAQQIVLPHDALPDSSGIYAVTLTVRNQYSGGSYETQVSDTLIVVNRNASRFGSGWSLAGVEELRLAQPGNKILWIGGEGSAKVYRNIATNTWLGAAGAFRDTLTYDPATATYTRLLRHGIQVKFDAAGRHIRTVNRVGQVSTFYWNASLNRLDSIAVPPAGVAGTVYKLTYDGNGKLDKITDPAGRALDATVVSGRLTSLQDPDGYATGFAYDATGRMTGRTTRRGYTTTYVYAKGLRVDTVKVPLNVATGDTAKTAFTSWDELGLAVGTGTQTAADTAVVHTTVDGPRSDVADVAQFWVDRWGAPTKIIDPIGAATTLVRGDTARPALVTKVTSADGRISLLTWDARANLVQQLDSTSHLANGLPTAITRWTYHSPNTRDAPDSVIDPNGVVTRYTYNSWGIDSTVTAANGHLSRFTYITTGALAGVLSAVTELQVPTWDSTSRAEVVQDQTTTLLTNALGNDTLVTSPMGHVTRFTRDTAQRITNQYDPGGHRTEFVYDALNRTLQAIQHVEGVDSGFAAPLVTRRHYAIDVLDSIIDPRNVARTYQYDAGGRQTAEVDDYGHIEARYFNRAGLVDSIKPRFYQGGAGVIRMTYDANGRVSKKAWPAREVLTADSVLYSYDALGRMLSATSARRKVVRTYFATGALKSEVQSLPGGTNHFTNTYRYDAGGRRTWYLVGTPGDVAHNDSVWYHYDVTSGDLRVIGVRWRGAGGSDSVRLAWDALGRRDTVTYTMGNNAAIKFAYDADGVNRLVCATHSGSAVPDVFNFTDWNLWVDADGLVRKEWRYPAYLGQSVGLSCGSNSTLSSSYDNTYDSRHQLRTQAAASTNSYAYDGSANIVRHREYSGTTVYRDEISTIDPGHNRLTHTDLGGGVGKDYVYAVDGNRIDEIPTCPGCQPGQTPGRRQYWYNGLGQTTGTSEYKCATDGNGNCQNYLYWWSDPNECLYDPVGRADDPCDQEGNELGFDGDNVTRTQWDSVGSGFGWTFVQGPGIDDPLMGYNPGYGWHLYWMTNGRGLQYAAGTADGYDCTSNVNAPCGNEYLYKGGKFAGGTKNATTFGQSRNQNDYMPGLSFFRNRFYDQSTGRWTQEDPLGVAGGVNLYAFNGNNPVMFTDPFGLCKLKTDPDCERIARAMVGATVGVKDGFSVGPVKLEVHLGASAEVGLQATRNTRTGQVDNSGTGRAQVGFELKLKFFSLVDIHVRVGPSTEGHGLIEIGTNPDSKGTYGVTLTVPPTGPVGAQGTYEVNIPAASREIRCDLSGGSSCGKAPSTAAPASH
jgi:RHS repeat-associated protein